MPELLLEIFCEEIPARMQARAAADLERMLTERLAAAGLAAERARTLVGPRRLTAVVEGLPATSPDVREERKGPRVDAPKPAIDGFLRGAGLKSLDHCEVRSDKRGDFYVVVLEKPGRPTPDIVAEAVPDLMRAFPWPKSMKTTGIRPKAGDFRWVRPLHRILCVFDGEVVPFEVGGVRSGDQTEGHRLLGRGPFRARSFRDYQAALEGEGAIVLDAGARAAMILKDAQRLCAAQGLELVEDQGLLDEVAGLAEHPVVLLGDMDPSFLDLPPEVIRLTMRTHQKYFAVRDPTTGALAPRFVVVANQSAPDGGAAIAAGNARVLSARLNDARYFWDHDRKTPLEEMAKGLAGVVFHQKLGSVADKVERVAALARELAPAVGADPDLAERAARLAKADLVSDMVGEFPELQGVMGRYYALVQAGLDPLASDPRDGRRAGFSPPSSTEGGGRRAKARPTESADSRDRIVADAIRDHYKPQGPSDSVPTEPTAIAVALADKLDTLVGFWAIGEKPTGSKDPYALRRAALGVVRIVLQNDVRLSLIQVLDRPFREAMIAAKAPDATRGPDTAARIAGEFVSSNLVKLMIPEEWEKAWEVFAAAQRWGDSSYEIAARVAVVEARHSLASLLSFFADRLKVHLRDEGHRHDLVDAVFALGEDDLVLIVKRVEALGRFLDMDDGKQLLAAYRRAVNILRDEEKKDGRRYDGEPQEALLAEPEERALYAALTAARPKVEACLAHEDFEGAMAALAPLRPAIDAFFDGVLVNAPDKELRKNRLLLLSGFRDALKGVADFSKIGG